MTQLQCVLLVDLLTFLSEREYISCSRIKRPRRELITDFYFHFLSTCNSVVPNLNTEILINRIEIEFQVKLYPISL